MKILPRKRKRGFSQRRGSMTREGCNRFPTSTGKKPHQIREKGDNPKMVLRRRERGRSKGRQKGGEKEIYFPSKKIPKNKKSSHTLRTLSSGKKHASVREGEEKSPRDNQGGP